VSSYIKHILTATSYMPRVAHLITW